MRYIARISDHGDEQPLKSHLLGAADLSRSFAEAFHAGELGYASGLLHDLGKYKEKVQLRIRGHPIKASHSTAGALTIGKDSVWRRMFGIAAIHRHLAQLVQFAIACHHGGLRNYGTIDEDGSLCRRLTEALHDPEEQESLWEAAWQEIELPELPIPVNSPLIKNLTKQPSKEVYCWKIAFLGRMLYSCLVDADTVDTRNFCHPELAIDTTPYPTIGELSERLDRYLAVRFKNVSETVVNQYRKAILDTCRRRAIELTPRIFSLTVPTGGGKTLSSLAFALRHAVKYGHRRIIYVIPLTSIIEQTARQFRKALGRQAVLEHHTNFDFKEVEEHLGEAESRRYKLSTENWDAPVIVTTSVQFFESLFANKRSKCRKLHNIARSVIILDEAQSLPRGFLEPCLRALEELVEGYGCSVVLCTATQPAWSALGRETTEIMDKPDPAELYEAFRRVQVEILGDPGNVTTDATIAERILSEHQALCIVNTRQHARRLLECFDPRTEGLFHLSGRMTPRHRMAVLKEIRKALCSGRPCRVISTQLIEAGVDVDFPVVFRAMAGIDSIAQAAGRCNREGKLAAGRMVVFHPETHGMPTKGWIKETAIEAWNSIVHSGADDPLSPVCIRDYFERAHGTRDPEASAKLRDEEGIVGLLTRVPPDIPYEEVARRFKLIDSDMEAVVVPWCPPGQRSNPEDPLDPDAQRLIESLPHVPHPAVVLRQLQPFTVQIYKHERIGLEKAGLLRCVQGVWVLNDLSYYVPVAGLLTPEDDTTPTVYIF